MISPLYFPIATVLTIFMTKYCMRHASVFSLVDIPRGRKQHQSITPVVGGIGIVFSFCAISVLSTDAHFISPAFWCSSILLFAVGVLDDMHEFGSRPKFVAQFAAAMLMIFWGQIKLESFGNLFGSGDISLGMFSVPFTVFAVVGVINALNMIDGIDGLSGSLGLISALVFSGIALFSGLNTDGFVLLLFASSIVGFLFLNIRTPWRSQAAVFLGDAGALFMGFVLAWYAIKLSSPQYHCVSPVVMLWILMVPLFDTVAVMLRRALNGVSPFKADRGHIHHLLLDHGMSVSATVAILSATSILMASIGVASNKLWQISQSTMFVLFLGLFAIYYFCAGRAANVSNIRAEQT